MNDHRHREGITMASNQPPYGKGWVCMYILDLSALKSVRVAADTRQTLGVDGP